MLTVLIIVPALIILGIVLVKEGWQSMRRKTFYDEDGGVRYYGKIAIFLGFVGVVAGIWAVGHAAYLLLQCLYRIRQ